MPDYKADVPPEAGMNPFIMNPEGVARLFAVDKMAEGPFPEHYEPFETRGTASPGAAPTCPTTRPTYRRKPG